MKLQYTYLASTIHMMLAVWILFLPNFPRPFGQLEPFFIILTPEALALVFIAASVLPIVALRAEWPANRMIYALGPQQAVLIYGAVGGFFDYMQDGDVRSLVALSWSAPLALFHGFDVWKIIKSREQGGGNGS